MIQYPAYFEVTAQAKPGMDSTWEAGSSNHPRITLSVPDQFSGPGGAYSPEDVYALSLQNCFIATFKVLAENSRLIYDGISVQARLTVDRDEKGMPWVSMVMFDVSLSGVDQTEKALRLLKKAESSGFILNSVKTRNHFNYTTIDGEGRRSVFWD